MENFITMDVSTWEATTIEGHCRYSEENLEKMKVENCEMDRMFNIAHQEQIMKIASQLKFFFVSRNRKHFVPRVFHRAGLVNADATIDDPNTAMFLLETRWTPLSLSNFTKIF